MATSRIAQAKLLTNPAVLQQLTASLISKSIAVLTEGTAIADHPNRLKYANYVISQPAYAASFMLPALLYSAANVANAGNAPDANGTPLLDLDMDNLVATVFTFYSDQYVASSPNSVQLQIGS